MFDIVISIVGKIFAIVMLIWMTITFVPDIIKTADDYINENKKFVMACLFITIAMALFLFTQNKIADTAAALIMIILSIPIFILFVALLTLVKSPYADTIGDLFF
jgi:hypothetical protein